MILTTTETAPGQRVVAVKGLVQGNTIRARHIGRDIMAGLRNIVGGEISEYTRLMTESRMQSTQRMIEQAEALGANAVIGVRFVTSMVMSGASELLAYGTAVVVEDEPQEQASDEAPGEDEEPSEATAEAQDEGDEPSASAQGEGEEPSEATAEAQDEGDEPSASAQDEGEEPSASAQDEDEAPGEATAEAQDEGDEPSASGQDEGDEPSEAAAEAQDEGEEPSRPTSSQG